MVKQFIKELVEEYFRTNDVKNITDLKLEEIHPIYREIGMHCADKVISEIEKLTLSEIQKMQNDMTIAKLEKKSVMVKSECKQPVKEFKPRGRKPKNIDCQIFLKRNEIPKNIDENLIRAVYTCINGKRSKKMYGILDTNLPTRAAQNNIRIAYSRMNKTNYLNVSLSRLENSRKTSKKALSIH